MQNWTKLLLIVLCTTLQIKAELGLDFSTLQPASFFQCVKSNGYTYVIPRAFHSYGSIDLNAVPNLNNARKAGLKTEIYMFPCRGKNATAQVDQLIKGVPQDLYDVIWVDVQTNPSTGCSWNNFDFNSNCQFLLQTLNRITSYGRKVGIYTTPYFWDKIFGARLACPKSASAMLWYARYDNSPAFTDYGQIGGWAKPDMKQYLGDILVCGVDSDKNYRP